MPSAQGSVTALLQRRSILPAACLAILAALAWAYLLAGAGLQPVPGEMAPVEPMSLDRHAMHDPAAVAAGPAMQGLLVLGMWWVMMIAMMSPGVTPAVLLYDVARRQAITHGDRVTGFGSVGAFVCGYLLAWLCFSALATGMQLALLRGGLLSEATLTSQSRALTAALLVAAGLYQLSSLKRACLAHCRFPLEFIVRYWRPGTAGALRLGVLHGSWCVACCWLLMVLLFVGGVMNPLWIAGIGALVLLEKLAPPGIALARVAGVLFIAWGVATLFL